MAKRKTHLDRLLAAIEKKRRLSLRELGKTDLYGGAVGVEDVTEWYDALIQAVKRAPPTERVGVLRILEDGGGLISSVAYEYRSEKATEHGIAGNGETVFVIESRIP